MKFDTAIFSVVLLLIATTSQQTFAENLNSPLVGKQRRLPNDIELKATYCLALKKLQQSDILPTVIKNNMYRPEDISMIDPELQKIFNEAEKILAESDKSLKGHVEEQGDQISRLRQYMIPRLPYLEPAPLLAANSRGEKDFYSQKKSPKGNQCMERCKNIKGNQWLTCFDPCMNEDELYRRTYQCNDLAFLPF